MYTLLGENGAGKSTTVEILEGHREATSGAVRVLDTSPWNAGREFRDRIGIVLQSSGVETEFTVREVIDLYGGCYRSPRPLDEVVGLVGLDEKVDARIGSLSGGQRRRVDLALGIIGRPDVLFLDEPTTGFDPAARRKSWDLIESLGADGTTVLLTTHYLDEAEHLADRVGVLSAGRLIAEGTPDAADQPGERHGRELHASRVGRDRRRVVAVRAAVRCRRADRRPFRRGDDRPADGRRPPAHRVGARGRGRTRVARRASRLARGRVPLPHRRTGVRRGHRRHGRRCRGGDGRDRGDGVPLDGEAAVDADRLPAALVPPDPDRHVLHARPAADHARAVQRPVRLGPDRHPERLVVVGAVLHRRAGRVHRGVGDVHQPRQHGAAPARRGRAQALARHAAADVDLPRRVHLFGGHHRLGRRRRDAGARRGRLRPRHRARPRCRPRSPRS